MKQFTAILLSLLMLASSTGLAVGAHYCGGKPVKTQLVIGHANIDCGMAKMQSNCKSPSSDDCKQIKRKSCCDNHYVSVDTDNTLNNKVKMSSLDVYFLVALIYTNFGIDPFGRELNTVCSYYSPPLLKRDTQILFQTFLI